MGNEVKQIVPCLYLRTNCIFPLLWSVQCGPHGDEGKVVGVWETLMSREVEGLPREWRQTPLCRGAVYCLCDQLESHLVVSHLYRTNRKEEGGNE